MTCQTHQLVSRSELECTIAGTLISQWRARGANQSVQEIQ